MYDGITNIIKINQTREYLNQRGVSPKILLNPRSYEGIENILEEVPFIRLDGEAALRLNERVQVKNGSMQIRQTNNTENLYKMSAGSSDMQITRERWDAGILSREKRYFNSDGIEIKRIYENAYISKEQWEEGKIECLPFERIYIEREEKRSDLIQKVYQKVGTPILLRKYYQRRKFLDFHDISVSKIQMNRFCLKEEDIFLDLGSKKVYEFVIEEDDDNIKNGINEYKKYNEKYGLTKIYQTGIEKLYLKGKMIGGE